VPRSDDRPALLEVDGAAKEYSDLVALSPLDLRVPAGQLVALVGHNGSGKSTFLKMASGLLEMSDGSITIDGAEAGSSHARATTSYLPDEPVLYDDLSVKEHCAYIAALHGVEATVDDFDELLERIGLGHRADDLPARFSRGLRQKTAIALSVVRPFDLMLVDEPFVGLDAPGKEALLGIFDELHDAGKTILVATHDPSFVERVDRCLALRDGIVIHDGKATPEEVLHLVGA
jgi:ABC-type multidrug transport system ATPase subunit